MKTSYCLFTTGVGRHLMVAKFREQKYSRSAVVALDLMFFYYKPEIPSVSFEIPRNINKSLFFVFHFDTQNSNCKFQFFLFADHICMYFTFHGPCLIKNLVFKNIFAGCTFTLHGLYVARRLQFTHPWSIATVWYLLELR